MPPCSVILWLALTQVPEPPPPDPTLRWSAPRECPDRAALLRGITRRRGRPLAPGDATVDASVHKQGARYLLRLHVRAGARSERRELAADSCLPLADATALLVALAVDAAASDPPAALPPGVEATPPSSPSPRDAPPDATSAARTGPTTATSAARTGPTTATSAARDSASDTSTARDANSSTAASDTRDGSSDTAGPSDTPAGPSDTPVGPSNTPASTTDTPPALTDPLDLAPDPPPATTEPLDRAPIAPPTPAPPVDRRPGGLVRLHGGPELGAVPGVSGAVGLAFGLLFPRVRLELQGTFVAPRGVQRPQAELRAWLIAAAVHVCARPGRGALEFPLCGGLELGGMRGAARGPELDRAGFGVWFGGVLGAGVAWRFRPRLALWAAVQALAAVRPSFRLDDPRGAVVLFEPPPVSGRLLLGLELRLGRSR